MMMESRGARGHDQGRAHRDQRPRRQGLPRGRGSSPSPSSTPFFVGNPIMHHLFLASIRPEPARRPSHWPSRVRSTAGQRTRPGHQCRARASMCCPASPAMSVRDSAAPAVRRPAPPGPNDASGRCRHQRRGSCSATPSAWLRPPRPPARPSRATEISSGQRAAPGAIERVRIDPATLEPRSKVIGSELLDRTSRAFMEAVGGARLSPAICGSAIIRGWWRRVSRRPDFEDDVDRGKMAVPEHAASFPPSVPGPICCTRSKAEADGHLERRPRHQLGKGSTLRRHRLLMEKGSAWRPSTHDLALRVLRLLHRPQIRHGTGAHPRLRTAGSEGRRQRRRYRRPDGHPEPRISPRDREHGEVDRGRSRRRWSRASSSCSWMPWRFPTASTPFPILPPR